MVKSPRDRLL